MYCGKAPLKTKLSPVDCLLDDHNANGKQLKILVCNLHFTLSLTTPYIHKVPC